MKAIYYKDKRSFPCNITVTGISLLSAEQAEKLPRKVLCLGKELNSYWLKDSGKYEFNTTAAYINGAGEICEEGFLITAALRVRPVLELSFHEEYGSGIKLYDEVKVFERVWIVISENALLLKNSLGDHCFRKDYEADDSNEYEASDIKKYINSWLEKKMKG